MVSYSWIRRDLLFLFSENLTLLFIIFLPLIAGIEEDGCGFIVAKDNPSIACGHRLQSTCVDEKNLVSLCPAECPFIDRSQFFPCLAKCVTENDCHPGLKGTEFPNKETKTCDTCTVIGCIQCDPSNPKQCLKCNEPVFKTKNGECIYTLESGFGNQLVTVIGILVLICLPQTLGKLFRPVARPEIFQAAQDHHNRCKVMLMRTEEEADGTASVHMSVPTFFKTNIHRDYICGAGIALYFNWIVFLGIWAFLCMCITGGVSYKTDFATIPTYSDQCPTLETLAESGSKWTLKPAKQKNSAHSSGNPANTASIPVPDGRRMFEQIDLKSSSITDKDYFTSEGSLEKDELDTKIGVSPNTVTYTEFNKAFMTRLVKPYESYFPRPVHRMLFDFPGKYHLHKLDIMKKDASEDNLNPLEQQRYEFAEANTSSSVHIFLLTFVGTILFAWFQRREEGLIDADNADMRDYVFCVEGLPPHVTSPDEIDSFIKALADTPPIGTPKRRTTRGGQEIEAKVLGTSLAFDYDGGAVIQDLGMSYVDVCERLLAREDVENLWGIYQREMERNLGGSAKGTLNSTGGMTLSDYTFPNKHLYHCDFFKCFFPEHNQRLWNELKFDRETEKTRGTTRRWDTETRLGGGTRGSMEQSPVSTAGGSNTALLTDSNGRDDQMKKYVQVGLVAPNFTDEQVEQIRSSLRSLQSAGMAYCFCNYESSVDVCLENLQEHISLAKGDPEYKEKHNNLGYGTNSELIDSIKNLKVYRGSCDPPDILWENFYTGRSFLQNWIYNPMIFVIQLVLYGVLLYTPAVIFMIQALKESSQVPAGMAMTILGILFSTGNGLVGLMFWNIATTLPFRYRKKQWGTVMVLYTLLFLLNTAFSIFLVFTQVYAGSARLKKENHDSIIGEETFLGKQIYELLVPGTFLMPYFLWPLTGYTLRKLLRIHNNFIPFTDDPKSARTPELRSMETYMEPPGIYIAWDYAAHITLPLCCVLFYLMACPLFVYKLFQSMVIWAVWMYVSQKYLMLSGSKITFYTSGILSSNCFNMFTSIIFLVASAVAWWGFRADLYHWEMVNTPRGIPIHGIDWSTKPAKSDMITNVLVYGIVASLVYQFILHFVLDIYNVPHKEQMEGEGIFYREVERRLGFNYENVNPILVLKSYFLQDQTRSVIDRQENKKPCVWFAPGKQYLLNNFDKSISFTDGRIINLWDMAGKGIAIAKAEVETIRASIEFSNRF